MVKHIGSLFRERVHEMANRNEDEKTTFAPIRVKHISHLDLDGYGATLLTSIFANAFPDNAVEVEIVNTLPTKLRQELMNTLNDMIYDLVIITDLAITQQIVDLVNRSKYKDRIYVFDHHVTNVVEVPETFTITTDSQKMTGHLTCATDLYHDYLVQDPMFEIFDEDKRYMIAKFVETVRNYDTFEFWKCRNSDKQPKASYDAPRLNILFHIMEREDFIAYIKDYVNRNRTEENTLTESYSAYFWISKILSLEENKNNRYVESALKRMNRVGFDYSIFDVKKNAMIAMRYKAGVVFAEKSSPIIANTALERFPDIDFCAIVSNSQVSIYSNRENVDVSKIAAVFNGGGHKDAAGFTIPYTDAAVFNIQHFRKIIECAGNLTPDQSPFEDQDVTDTN